MVDGSNPRCWPPTESVDLYRINKCTSEAITGVYHSGTTNETVHGKQFQLNSHNLQHNLENDLEKRGAYSHVDGYAHWQTYTRQACTVCTWVTYAQVGIR